MIQINHVNAVRHRASTFRRLFGDKDMNEKDSFADRMFFQADGFIKEGRVVDARNLLEECIEKYPTHGRSYNHLGWLHQEKYKDFVAAEKNFVKALEYAPEYPAVYKNYAFCLSTQRKFNELEKLLERALTVSGVDPSFVYEEYAIMYELQGDYRLAIQYFTEFAKTALDQKLVSNGLRAIDRCKLKSDFALQ